MRRKKKAGTQRTFDERPGLYLTLVHGSSRARLDSGMKVCLFPAMNMLVPDGCLFERFPY